jgi:hypothetical protein
MQTKSQLSVYFGHQSTCLSIQLDAEIIEFLSRHYLSFFFLKILFKGFQGSENHYVFFVFTVCGRRSWMFFVVVFVLPALENTT